MVIARSLQRMLAQVCATLLLAGSAAAETTALVQARSISLSDSFQVVISTDQDVSEPPDFSPLEQDFDILGQSKSSNISIVNGKMSRATNWVLELMAKREGTLTLPPLTVGKERTAPAEITVTTGSRAQTGAAPADVDLEIDVDNLAPYVQQQFIFTVRLVHTAQFGDASLSEPTVTGGGVVVEKLGDDIAYESTRGQTRVGIIERRYALFAQSSGTIRIEPLRFEARVSSGRGMRFDPFARGRIVRKQSDAIEVDVQPVPADFDGATWLPAAELALREQAPAAGTDYRVGEPFTRTLTVEANGLAASQLPEIQAGLPDSLKQYPDQPVLENRAEDDGLVSRRQEKIAIIPSQAGKLTLPPIEIPWWNTRTGRQEYARLPARSIEVLPGTGAAIDAAAGGTVAIGEPDSEPVPAATGERENSDKGPQIPWAGSAWRWPPGGWQRQRPGIAAGERRPRCPAKQTRAAARKNRRKPFARHAQKARQKRARMQCCSGGARMAGQKPAQPRRTRCADRWSAAAPVTCARPTPVPGNPSDWDGQAFWDAFANRQNPRLAEKQPPPAELEPLYR